MNATIEICRFRIKISDPCAEEEVRDIVELKLIFSQNHNLLMYLKVILAQLADKLNSSEAEKESDSSVSLSEDDESLSWSKKAF